MNAPRWVFVSPHLDDAALSCGGLISDLVGRGVQCINITVTAGIPELTTKSSLIDEVQNQWKLNDSSEAVKLRRVEDNNAMRILNCKPIHLNFLDAIYRSSIDAHYFYQSIYDPIHPEESGLAEEIAHSMMNYLLPDDLIILPQAIGGHVDHEIVKNSAQFLTNKRFYYPDVPYVFKTDFSILDRYESSATFVYPFKQKHITKWIEAIQAYPSQLSSLFKDSTELNQQVTAYYSRFKGIILLPEGS
ncbi:MAG TPA: PIG-L family deacetylase [Anaerolineales bacterium]|nr:PIG-L family deacetylase [Anaerolineales bacterium]